jgi:hypothetical protein
MLLKLNTYFVLNDKASRIFIFINKKRRIIVYSGIKYMYKFLESSLLNDMVLLTVGLIVVTKVGVSTSFLRLAYSI